MEKLYFDILDVSFRSLTNYPINKTFSLSVLLGLISIVTVIKAPTQPWLTSWFDWYIALKGRRDNSQQAIKKILSLPLEFYDENNPGRISGRVARGIFNYTWGYPEIAGQFIPKITRALVIFVFITVIEWRISILFFASFVFIFSFIWKQIQYLIKCEMQVDKYMENTESRTSELVTNIKTVKAYATEAREFKRQSQRIEREIYVVIYRLHRSYVKVQTFQRTVVQFSVLIILSFALIATLNGKISLGHFIVILTMTNMAYAELEPISILIESFSRRYSPIIRFNELLAMPLRTDNIFDQESADDTPYQFTGKIELSHVSFSYHPNRPVLQNINFLIKPYQTVALVGKSGSGKSTLIKLLLRYFEPNTGKILIDGEDINSLDIIKYRRRLAIVHQEVDIFNGTVLDNLKYGRPDATLEQIQEACRIARVDEVIEQLSHGYNTIVGERGVRLSGGQRQRLGIARALLVEPDVLIFDEATSSLDSESERAIQVAMNSIQGTRTTIIIAHRLSTIRNANQILVLDQGKIAEVGNHSELLQRKGIYYRLHSLQETGGRV
ncbi:MAG: ABC transporter ATP-binding protein [Sphaerospermopsis sp. SIO1G2]|nr:ABC transporter ATP-binding protein [Sphaerospermopsis sp. SIO1G2]